MHYYQTTITWTGNLGQGTRDYRAYERDHTISVAGKPEIPGTSEVSLLGNKVRYNPEELLLASLAACHMMWYLFLCSKNGVVIETYVDNATMVNTPDGGGHFTEAVLHPQIGIAGNVDTTLLDKLQHEANKLCFIANSCNFPVKHQPVYTFGI